MQVRRIVWLGVSALALASWFASASTSVVRPPAILLPPSPPAGIDRAVAGLQSEIARLQERLGPTAAPSRSRDLFRFSAPAQRRRLSVSPRAESTSLERPAAPQAAPPVLKLIGIAEDVSADGVVRTAIIAGWGDVILGRAGETIAGHYQVDQVSADTVQLTDSATGLSVTLALR